MLQLIRTIIHRALLPGHCLALIAISYLASNSFTLAVPTPPPVNRPLDDIIKDLSENTTSHGFQAARDFVAAVIAGDGSSQGYESKAKDEFIRFQGPYTFPALAAADIGKYRFGLALFSDDGCDLNIQELPAPMMLAEYGIPQALPDTDESFEVFSGFFDPGQQVTMDVWYSNVKFIENGSYVDIDGCTLFIIKRPYIAWRNQ